MNFKFLFLFISLSVGIFSQQNKKIDFLTTDVKGLSESELREYENSRKSFISRLRKSIGYRSEIKSLVIQGNKIKTILYNTGSISRPGITGNVLDLVWNGLGYGYEFGPLVGAKVPKAKKELTDTLKIVTEGFDSPSDGEYGPDGLKWGWLPKVGYSASGQPDVASWGARAKVNNDLRLRPPSWPESWYNAGLNQYVYPSFLGGNSTVPDEELYYVVDDYTKKEFDYYPFADDSSKRGLGLNLEVRTFQFSNPLAEDIIFLVYTAENSSPKTLPKVYFGMFGDPHVGGDRNYSDDAASFIPSREGTVFKDGNDLTIINGVLTSQRSRNLVYAWDPDQKSDVPNMAPGYFGYKFLESPNNSIDNLDNDDDGIIDEDPFGGRGVFLDQSQAYTGIADTNKYIRAYGKPKARWSGDEDGDWDLNRDDVGVDGILNPNAPDFGEGNGMPDQLFSSDGTWMGSEPNFGFRDVNESDQIGLKSFWALEWGGSNRPKNDILMYDKISSDTSDVSLLYPPTQGDNIFLYGSGPFALRQGGRQRFSIALLMGSDLNDLLLNSEIAQRILEANYRFAQPPPKPVVRSVAGNGRVTLYWNTDSENAKDPLTNENDFMGYKIYRSEDYTFSDVFSITDGAGYPFLGKALYDDRAQKSAIYHNPWSSSEKSLYVNGYHPTEYLGRSVKYYMGDPNDNSGLRHQYIDSTVTNGKTYFYAVVAFDRGVYTDSLKLPPTETQAIIQRDAVTQEFRFDVNTSKVTPSAYATDIINPSDTINIGKTLQHTSGVATGKVKLQVLDPISLGNNSYKLSFKKIKIGTDTVLAYSILRETLFEENFYGKETLFVSLLNINIVKSSVVIKTEAGQIVDVSQITVDSVGGLIKAKRTGILIKGSKYIIQYQYYPIVNSRNLSGQDANQTFDGFRLFLTDDPLALDLKGSSFNVPTTKIIGSIKAPTIGTVRVAPFDIRVTFNKLDTLADGSYKYPGDTLGTQSNPNGKYLIAPFKISNSTDNTEIRYFVGKTGTTITKWKFGDKIIIRTPAPYDQGSSAATMMEVNFNLPSDLIVNINGGEFFTGKTTKPFVATEEYKFTTSKVAYDASKIKNELKNIFVVPNPYVISSQFEQPANKPDLRGDRALQFRNLPKKCLIRIYTITGELIRTLEKNDETDYLSWDLLTSESARTSYGVYVYQVEAEGATTIGRFGVIK
ncbi:MAG: hypothetical protein O3A55_02225 [Bacteroidetes bacterium]|nr:hypothetical protein [Bacteroidota bacterium]